MRKISKDSINLCDMPLSCFAKVAQIDMFTEGQVSVYATDPETKKPIYGFVRMYNMASSGDETPSVFSQDEEDVLVGLIELTYRHKFENQRVEFNSLYEIIKVLNWSRNQNNYNRLITSLKTLKSTTIETNMFYDNKKKLFGSALFSILDEVIIHERKPDGTEVYNKSGWIKWSDTVFKTFEDGLIKNIDIELYHNIKIPAARKLFRILDKRFYYGQEIWLPLEYLACNLLRLKKIGAWYYRNKLKDYAEELKKNHFIENYQFKIKGGKEFIHFYKKMNRQLIETVDAPELYEGMIRIGIPDKKAAMLIKTRNHQQLKRSLNLATNAGAEEESSEVFMKALDGVAGNSEQNIKPTPVEETTSNFVISDATLRDALDYVAQNDKAQYTWLAGQFMDEFGKEITEITVGEFDSTKNGNLRSFLNFALKSINNIK